MREWVLSGADHPSPFIGHAVGGPELRNGFTQHLLGKLRDRMNRLGFPPHDEL
jgi:hypothetical protein